MFAMPRVYIKEVRAQIKYLIEYDVKIFMNIVLHTHDSDFDYTNSIYIEGKTFHSVAIGLSHHPHCISNVIQFPRHTNR